MSFHYRNFADVAAILARNLGRIPRDVDTIVGIPRSGLMVGNLLALMMNRRLTDVDGLLEGRLLGKGHRKTGGHDGPPRKVLIVDDSIHSGRALAEVRQRLAAANLDCEVKYLAVYVAPGHEDTVDYALETVPLPRCFQWNVMHHRMLGQACVDIDGVLCVDPTIDENDDGDAYRTFLSAAVPLHTPTREIGWLVTSRLEKYRKLTEDWLAEHDVRYRHLVMLDLPDKAARQRAGGRGGAFKAKIYHDLADAELFIESEPQQAATIAKLSWKPVICTETMELVDPSLAPRDAIRPTPLVRLAQRQARRVVRRLKKLAAPTPAATVEVAKS